MDEPSTGYVDSVKKKLLSPTATISTDILPEHVDRLFHFFPRVGFAAEIPDHCNAKDFYSDLLAGVLDPLTAQTGSLSYLLTVKPSIINYFLRVHGGALAAIAEAVSKACAKTVFPEDKEIFLGELSVSYLSGAKENDEVIIEAKVVRKGRNVTVVAVEFRLKETQNLIYLTRATFYNMPASKL